jgi:membrane protease YdiL (CAAX protease family)
MLVALSLAVELAFRGLIHGTLAKAFPIQCGGGPWRLSVPILASSVLYAACLASSCGTTWPPISSVAALAGTGAPLPLAGGFVFGVASGLVRERSESVTASVLLHWLALGAWLGACALGL